MNPKHTQALKNSLTFCACFFLIKQLFFKKQQKSLFCFVLFSKGNRGVLSSMSIFLIMQRSLFFFIVVQTQLSLFSHHHFPPSHPPPPPTLNPPLLRLCLWVLYTCSLMTLPLLSPLPPSLLPSGYCQFVFYFNLGKGSC